MFSDGMYGGLQSTPAAGRRPQAPIPNTQCAVEKQSMCGSAVMDDSDCVSRRRAHTCEALLALRGQEWLQPRPEHRLYNPWGAHGR